MTTSPYNQEQAEAIVMVRRHLEGLAPHARARLRRRIRSYLAFRQEVARFHQAQLATVCSEKCFSTDTSACCGREGIATFFADVVINILLSSSAEIDALLLAVSHPTIGPNCVYLSGEGCLWRLKPIVCEMFLCDHAKTRVFGEDRSLRSRWERLRRRERLYTWPTRPVLFDVLEALFRAAGLDSPLMYFHKSPGLLRLKARARGDVERPRNARERRSDGDC
ncbi:MAG: hypothetical protein HGB17_13455 [Syntrophobacteraceae bacterium]|nr:hypothetical protein [Syntrophobacteraceae bacterium]